MRQQTDRVTLLIGALRGAIGRNRVLSDSRRIAPFQRGYRVGEGHLDVVVKPRSLVEMWRSIQICSMHRAAVIVQAANTGLTGGSTPFGDYDRPVVLISTRALDAIHLIEDGRQVLCLPGATLSALERKLAPIGRAPHSVIGSSCIGASVVGGICNNSGGALVQRGPAYTELALFARSTLESGVELVNHLGIALEGAPEEILTAIERGDFQPNSVFDNAGHASNIDYEERLRDVQASSPARYNANPDGLFEASGCAGKLAVFAVRLDTFPKDCKTRTFYVGTNDPDRLIAFRRAALTNLAKLPVAAEYVHRDAFDLADRYGKDMFLAIRLLGTERLPWLHALQQRLSRWSAALGLGSGCIDRLLVRVAGWFPDHLPARMRAFRDSYEHHLLLTIASEAALEVEDLLAEQIARADAAYFVCTPDEASKAFLHRFVVAGSAIRFRNCKSKHLGDLVAIDVALPRNATTWFDPLPPIAAQQAVRSVIYGHFFCLVFHQDYVLARGVDSHAFECRLLDRMDERGAEYPAEHNVGHCYKAKPALADFYSALDPANMFNPGIGGTPRTAPGKRGTDKLPERALAGAVGRDV